MKIDPTFTLRRGYPITERKIRYDSSVVEHHCVLVEKQSEQMVLFHRIETPFTMTTNKDELTVTKGCYTIAYYWKDHPYNLYIWRDSNGNYLGAYFNIVKNTSFTDQYVVFEDLIIDILVFPNGDYVILDEEELVEPLERFEGGEVQEILHRLTPLLSHIISEAKCRYKHENIVQWLV
ncbi:DUF402 domain-containing protein [Sutcliffiella halmapala]|uniref:DUF402 domain-containing protein n=1 Tax=Sutcliffiella halmapala TaxID=79882 RepID=UPI0009949D39|nr:DUF402 domain-containing protein [Sutcliffiella halmapala]